MIPGQSVQVDAAEKAKQEFLYCTMQYTNCTTQAASSIQWRRSKATMLRRKPGIEAIHTINCDVRSMLLAIKYQTGHELN